MRERPLMHGAALLSMIVVAMTPTACSTPENPPAALAATAALPATQQSTRPSSAGADTPEWHYEGAAGPAHWGSLSSAFSACGMGRAQSPIDIDKPARSKVPEMKSTLPPATLRIVHHDHVADGINNGHTIQINYSGGDTLAVADRAYQLAQYHFHAPSEHTVGGRHSRWKCTWCTRRPTASSP
jgi:carbonic anhydrase